MNSSIETKYNLLKAYFNELEEVVIAYSGGVDSTLLLKVAFDELGDEVIAVLAKSETMPAAEFADAIKVARKIGVEPNIIYTRELEIPEYFSNPENRCYHCKKHIFGVFNDFMEKNMLIHLLDGSNADDSNDYRPGEKALSEFDVISPLKDFGFTKDEIRELSKELGLVTWNKESMSCLATRVAYNEPITIDKLQRIEAAEDYLRGLSFTKVRARMEEGIMRVEVNPSEVKRFDDDRLRQEVYKQIMEIGAKNVLIEKDGYRMGSMNKLNMNYN